MIAKTIRIAMMDKPTTSADDVLVMGFLESAKNIKKGLKLTGRRD